MMGVSEEKSAGEDEWDDCFDEEVEEGEGVVKRERESVVGGRREKGEAGRKKKG